MGEAFGEWSFIGCFGVAALVFQVFPRLVRVIEFDGLAYPSLPCPAILYVPCLSEFTRDCVLYIAHHVHIDI